MTDNETKLDALKRPYNAAKFLPRFDRRGWWINRNAGRRRLRPESGPFPASQPPPSAAPQPAPALATPGMTIGGMISFDDINKAASAAPPADAGAPAPAGEAVVIESVAAETCIGILQTALVLIGDDEGLLTRTEKEALRRPLQRVLDKYDIGEKMLPAELDLAICVGTLLITRLQKPKTATWFARTKAWFADRFFRAKGNALAGKMRREVGEMPSASAPAPAAKGDPAQ
jgi:hypothetical protein